MVAQEEINLKIAECLLLLASSAYNYSEQLADSVGDLYKLIEISDGLKAHTDGSVTLQCGSEIPESMQNDLENKIKNHNQQNCDFKLKEH